MYNLDSLKAAIDQPRIIATEINTVWRQGAGYKSSPVTNPEGVDIPAADWDNLIVLDACRYDVFKEVAELPGELNKVESKASATAQWLRSNFSGVDLADTVYVTGNPQLYRHKHEGAGEDPIDISFYDRDDVWQNNWADEYRTVLPEPITDAGREAAKKHPHKRLIVHYMQPHAPYVGPTGQRLPSEYLDFWCTYRRGEFDIDLKTVQKAYRENLELVLEDISQLLEELEGKTVVTADHAELLGDRDAPIPIRRFGHPENTAHPDVLTVPWLVYQNGSRRTIKAGVSESTDTQTMDADIVEKRLHDLGYKT